MSHSSNGSQSEQSRLSLRLGLVNEAVGSFVSWLTLVTVLICFATVYLRYAFGIGLIWLQEAYMWTHAAAILLGSGFAFLSGNFISVDLYSKKMSSKARSWVTLIGSLVFLLPFLWFMGSTSLNFFGSSYQMNERSAYEDGLPATYLLKGMMLIFVALLALQGLAQVLEALKNLRATRIEPIGH